MSVYEQLPQTSKLVGVWRGIIATGASNFTDTVEVLINAFDNKHRWGPCLWMPRDDTLLPVRGDECLVVFDEK